MISIKIKLSILMAYGFSSFICFCISLAATGTNFTQIQSAPFLTSHRTYQGITYDYYYGLVYVGSTATTNGFTGTDITKWSNLCTDDDASPYSGSCNDCVYANNVVMGTVSFGFITCMVACIINFIQLYNSSAALPYIASICMFNSSIMCIAAFSTYVDYCYDKLHSDGLNSLQFGNGFNATIAAFVFTVMAGVINCIPAKREDANLDPTVLINSSGGGGNSSGLQPV